MEEITHSSLVECLQPTLLLFAYLDFGWRGSLEIGLVNEEAEADVEHDDGGESGHHIGGHGVAREPERALRPRKLDEEEGDDGPEEDEGAVLEHRVERLSPVAGRVGGTDPLREVEVGGGRGGGRLPAEVQHGVVHAVVGLTLSRSLLQPLLISRFFFVVGPGQQRALW